jgi:outer membrane protein assembly factor BamA
MKLDKGKDSGFKATVKKIFGEKPVYLDTNSTKESLSRLTEYLFNKGYFDATVTLKSKIRHKNQLKLWYITNLGVPHFVSDIKYVIHDSNIKSVIEHSTIKPLIVIKQKYDSDLLLAESDRITTILNNNGYYKFNKNFIYYEVDTATFRKQNNVAVTLFIQNFSDTSLHKVYFIRNIFLEPDYKLAVAIKRDSLLLKEFTYITQSNILKANTFYRHIRFSKGELFSLEKVKQTINQLSDIQFFKYIDISFVENENYKSDSVYLDCNIKLTPMNKREVSTEVEVNTTAENKVIYQTSDRYYGMAGSINFRNRNLFRQAIQLTLGVTGAFDVQSQSIANQILFGNYQVGVNSALYFPTAYLPRAIFDSKRCQSSKTAIDLSYFYEYNSDYTRTTSNLAYIYQLNKRITRHFITPLELSLVKTDLQPGFAAKLTDVNDPLLNNIFETHLLTITKYSTIYNDKVLKQDHYWSIYFGIETAGNLCYLFNRLTSNTLYTDSTVYTLAGLNFFNYIKGEVDISYHYNIGLRNSIASRINFGLGIPYGNSNILPFEKRYFIGGANSIRAWAMRELGPGSYKDTTNVHYEQSGGLKLEGSLEYRFDIYALLKGAF